LGTHDRLFRVRAYVGQMEKGLDDAGYSDDLIPLEWVSATRKA
jgi:hypothetical protein